MKKKKQKKTDAAGKYTRPAAGPGGSGPGISSGPYGGAQQLPALQTIPFQPLQIQQEPMQPLPLAPGCERGASRGTKERTPADPAGKCGATFEQSENGAASTLPPAGATTGQRGFAQRNGAEQRQAPGCERGASRGTKERTPADPAGKCGATFEQSENGVASTLPPAGATTGQPGFAAGEMRPNGSKGRGFAVGAPARRSRDGNGKIAAPVGPMTGQRGFAAGEMEGE